jgi:predicted DCC family thiol-disulfide oxidoreductase YuxK
MAEIDLTKRSPQSMRSHSPKEPAGAAQIVSRVTEELQRRLVLPNADMIIIYDGQCVFCSAYVQLLRLRAAVGQVQLLDARTDNIADLVKQEFDLDLNNGMLVLHQGRYYYGADAMTFLSALTSPVGALNRSIAVVFRSRRLSRLLYPLLKVGRRATLALLGRSTIALSGADASDLRRASG